MSDEKVKLQHLCPDIDFFFLDTNSIATAMTGQPRPEASDLIAVVSGWEKFIAVAKLYLVAAQIDPESVVACSISDPNWKRAADQASLVICDSFVAKQLQSSPRVKVFPIIARSSLEQLR